MSKTFVVAGDHNQAMNWIKSDISRQAMICGTWRSISDYVIVTDSNKLRGVKDPHGVFIGTWKDRVDIKVIVEILLSQSTTTNPSLGKIWREVKDKVKPTPKKVFVGRGVTGIWVDEYDDSVKQAAQNLAKHIDDEVMRTMMMKVNSGNNQ